jgi:hypothetical protein
VPPGVALASTQPRPSSACSGSSLPGSVREVWLGQNPRLGERTDPASPAETEALRLNHLRAVGQHEVQPRRRRARLVGNGLVVGCREDELRYTEIAQRYRPWSRWWREGACRTAGREAKHRVARCRREPDLWCFKPALPVPEAGDAARPSNSKTSTSAHVGARKKSRHRHPILTQKLKRSPPGRYERGKLSPPASARNVVSPRSSRNSNSSSGQHSLSGGLLAAPASQASPHLHQPESPRHPFGRHRSYTSASRAGHERHTTRVVR